MAIACNQSLDGGNSADRDSRPAGVCGDEICRGLQRSSGFRHKSPTRRSKFPFVWENGAGASGVGDGDNDVLCMPQSRGTGMHG